MKKNLFDYATKELSQDAFLLWLFANYDDEVVGEASKKLIAKFVSLSGDNVDYNSIRVEKVLSQASKIDIVVDFVVGHEKCVLVIEDKVSSNQHDNQLDRYRETVKKWNGHSKRKSYFIFYKLDYCSKDEIDYLNDDKKNYVNNNLRKWFKFDIDDVCGFFSQYKDNPNLIMRSYVEHVSSVHSRLNIVSSETVDKWDYVEGLTFFRKEIGPLFNNYLIYNGVFQGTYSYYSIYYEFKNTELNKKVYPILEFVFRENSAFIHLYLHISFRKGNEWTWKWQDNEIDVSQHKKSLVDNIVASMVRHGFEEKDTNNSRVQTIASKKLSKKDIYSNDLKIAVEEVINQFISEMEIVDKAY